MRRRKGLRKAKSERIDYKLVQEKNEKKDKQKASKIHKKGKNQKN